MLGTGGFGDFSKRFEEFASICSRFCHDLMKEVSEFANLDPMENEQQNLEIARTVFAKWSIEILSLLYTSRGDVAFSEIRKALGGRISQRVLSTKLARLEELELIERLVYTSKPPRVHYSLTEKGSRLAKLGEPVFLYLRMTENLLVPVRVEVRPVRTPQRAGGGGRPR